MMDTRSLIEDEARLCALADRNIVGTAPESGFDDAVLVAAALCGAPIGLVTLIERDYQSFKAQIGTDLPGTTLDVALCVHALAQQELLVIPDLTADPRTRNNPIVTGELALRFYAGAPLVTPDGHMLGTICVLDTEPHPAGLNAAQRAAMEALARQVMALIEMRRTVGDHEDTLEVLTARGDRLVNAEEAGRIGTFAVEIATDVMSVSAEFCRIFGVSPRAVIHTADVEALVIADDRDRRSSPDTRLSATAEPDVEYRIRRPDTGRVHWISRRARFDRDAEGRPTHMYGTVEDVTERRRAEERMQALLALGDRLRLSGTIGGIAGVASETLGATLDTARACYVQEQDASGEVTVVCDWTDGDAPTIRQENLSATLPATVRRLRAGTTVAVANIRAADWIDSDRAGYAAMNAGAVVAVPMSAPGEPVRAMFVHDVSPRTWQPTEIEFIQGVADRTHAEIAKLEAEAGRLVLNQELSHRLKNTLTMVQALASQTLKAVPDRAPVMAFEQRLIALGAAHEVLLRQDWSASRIDAVATEVLATLGQINRIDISGPDVTLGSRAALSLSLVLHELGTNALKYGSLCVETGRVSLDWDIAGEGDNAVLTLNWRERGGPPPQAQTRKGFGSRLINMGLLGTGGVETRFATSGLEATFTAGLRRAQRA